MDITWLNYGCWLRSGHFIWRSSSSWQLISRIFVTRLTRQGPLMEQELLTIPEYLSSPTGFECGSCYLIFSFMCMFCRSLFVLFLLAIVLSVLFRYTNSNYPFDIFKLFFALLKFNIVQRPRDWYISIWHYY